MKVFIIYREKGSETKIETDENLGTLEQKTMEFHTFWKIKEDAIGMYTF